MEITKAAKIVLKVSLFPCRNHEAVPCAKSTQEPCSQHCQQQQHHILTPLQMHHKQHCVVIIAIAIPWEEVTRTSGKEDRWENQSQKPGTQPPIQHFYYSAPH